MYVGCVCGLVGMGGGGDRCLSVVVMWFSGFMCVLLLGGGCEVSGFGYFSWCRWVVIVGLVGVSLLVLISNWWVLVLLLLVVSVMLYVFVMLVFIGVSV